MRPLRLAAAATLLALTGCGSGDDAVDGTGATPAATPSTPSGDADPSSSPEPSAYPDFAPTDYTYRLEVLCYCPQVGAVRVEVVDGAVASARTVTGPGRGRDAPAYARLTINDIIAKANDPAADEVEVTWPDGQDHPSVVAIDQLAQAVDDEVTYTISRVRVR